MARPSLDEIFGTQASGGRPSLDEIFGGKQGYTPPLSAEQQAPKWAMAPAVEDAPTAQPQEERPGLLKRAGLAALQGAGWLGDQVARVSTSPLIGGVGDVQKAREERGGRSEGLSKFLDPQEYADVGRFVGGAIRNFGKTPDQLETTSTRVAEKYGVPSTTLSQVVPSLYSETGEGLKLKRGGFLDPSASGTAGFVGEALTPIPGLGQAAGALKMSAKTTGKVTGKVAEATGKGFDILTGTKGGTKTVNSVKSAINALGESFDSGVKGLKQSFGSKQAPDFERSVATAVRNGIDPALLPEAVEFGPQSIVTRTARVRAEGPLGQPLLEKFEKAKDEVRNAVTRDVERIGGGRLPTPVEAGEILREGFNAGVDRAFADVATSHKAIMSEAPGLRLSKNQIQKIVPKLAGYETWAKAKADNGLTNAAKEQGRQILRAIDKFRKKGESYAGAYDALQEIGDVAFKSTNSMADIAPDIKRFRALYGDINEAMIGTIDEAFPAGTGDALRQSNAEMSKIFGDKGLLGALGEKTASGEDLFRSVLAKGSTKQIKALKDYMSPEQLQAVKASFLHDLIKLDPQGNFTFRATFNRLRDNWDAADALFEPGELDNFLDLIRLGDKFGSAVMSTSGTGASGAIREFLSSAKNNAVDIPISEGIKKKSRAVGFDVEELKRTGQGRRPTPAMSLHERGLLRFGQLANDAQIRSRTLRAFAYPQREEEK